MQSIIEQGGPLMYPLMACSVIALSVILERTVFWILQRVKSNESQVEKLFHLAEKSGGLKIKDEVPDAEEYDDCRVRMLINGIRHLDEGLAESMEAAAMEEISRMKRGLALMHTVVAVAPLLGILGTVLGIISSFEILGQAGIDDPRAVTSGIAQALITTAAGLSIAIATLLPYEYFKSKVRKATEELSLVATRFELAFKKGRNVEG